MCMICPNGWCDMKAYADNTIVIQNPLKEIEDGLKHMLQWPNPDYTRKIEMGKSVWNVPRDIVLWQKRGDSLIVPFGMLGMLRSYYGISVDPHAHLRHQDKVFSGQVIGLYDYQQDALNAALKAKNGVLVAPCGSGKTQIGIAIIGSLGYRTLWLTHTHELLKQSMERAKGYLNVPMGTITGGKINASSGITFATVQTMSKIDLSEFRHYWDIIIVDECHRCVGTPTQVSMFWKVLSGLSARYKIGLTATPKRGDGLERAMFALLGSKFYEISRSQIQDKIVPLKVSEPIYTGWEPDFDKAVNPDGTLNYTSLITNCIEDERRNSLISDVIDAVADDGPTLVLSERVAHLTTLANMCKHPHGELSTCKKSERGDLLNAISCGSIKVLFATYAIAKEGLDIPCLKHLVMASPIKDETAVTQSAGRVTRKFPQKEFGTIWDFEDEMSMLKKWLRKRLSIYDKINQS